MQLTDLLQFDSIIVQCHDNPDADAIASGFALYTYFASKNKNVRFIYSGRRPITKPNLKMMLDMLEIGKVLEYVQPHDFASQEAEGSTDIPELIITTDCQYSAGNVTRFSAQNVAIIDHHQQEITDVKLCRIDSKLGSCSTLVWLMLSEVGYSITDKKLGTALYYGLYTDTNSLAEIHNPYDKDMRDTIIRNESLIHTFRNSNLSLSELEIAGVAMIRYIYNAGHHYALIKAAQCDPNILGLISDMLVQVAEVLTCVVYNEWPDGYKFSVRSCTNEVRADELAAFLSDGVGSGGGHNEKAGGFISKKFYDEKYPTLHAEAFFSDRMNEYFETCDIIRAADYEIDPEGMKEYTKKRIPLGYVKATDVFAVGTHVTVRTLEGDSHTIVNDDLIFMIGIKGEVYSSSRAKFDSSYTCSDLNYAETVKPEEFEYPPTVFDRDNACFVQLIDKAHVCISNGGTNILARKLNRRVKIFNQWYEEKYMYGKLGDYLAVRTDDYHDIYVVEHDIFHLTYEPVAP